MTMNERKIKGCERDKVKLRDPWCCYLNSERTKQYSIVHKESRYWKFLWVQWFWLLENQDASNLDTSRIRWYFERCIFFPCNNVRPWIFWLRRFQMKKILLMLLPSLYHNQSLSIAWTWLVYMKSISFVGKNKLWSRDKVEIYEDVSLIPYGYVAIVRNLGILNVVICWTLSKHNNYRCRLQICKKRLF